MSNVLFKNKFNVKNFLKSIILLPLSFLWERFYRLRRSFYEYGILPKKVFKVPVISVGNLSFGGTGKTPLIIWLSNWLNERNLSPVILTRGYKGQLEHSSGLLKSGQKFRLNPVDYGDEPLMISNKLKHGAVIVGKKRAENLEKYFAETHPDVVLLDDGFQHLQIHRSYNILLFDATMDFARYKVAPMGYLREGMSSLKNADAIIISRSDIVEKSQLNELTTFLKSQFHHEPVFAFTRYLSEGIFDVKDNLKYEINDVENLRVIAVTAIASPESFYKYLEGLGVEICEKVNYPDHYFFELEDINNLLLRASQLSAIILCSEKDMVKIKRVSSDPRIMCTKVKVDFINGENELVGDLRRILRLDS